MSKVTFLCTTTLALNGTLVECFGPANSIDLGNRVNGSTLQILGISWLVTTHFFVHYHRRRKEFHFGGAEHNMYEY